MSSKKRKPPKDDALEHAAKGMDKTNILEVKYINCIKGRGIFAKKKVQQGDFVVEYKGELIDSAEEERRRRVYSPRCSVFMYNFQWHEKTWCIDASREDQSFGRLVNDNVRPNCKMKKLINDGKPHLFLFALRDIDAGEEISYDYGGTGWPWRKKASGKEAS
ncbi:unnamed protein product [Knipowitschia caucasica]